MGIAPVAAFDTTLTIAAPDSHQRYFTLIAIREQERWASLCRELGIASCGVTADEALANLDAAIRDVLALESEGGPQAGEAVSDAELEEFITGHSGQEAIRSLVEAIG